MFHIHENSTTECLGSYSGDGPYLVLYLWVKMLEDEELDISNSRTAADSLNVGI